MLGNGLGFPEGPVALSDGSIALVEIQGGRVSRVDGDGNVSVVAEVGGAPTGLARGPDGALYVCNASPMREAGRGPRAVPFLRVRRDLAHMEGAAVRVKPQAACAQREGERIQRADVRVPRLFQACSEPLYP